MVNFLSDCAVKESYYINSTIVVPACSNDNRYSEDNVYHQARKSQSEIP